MFKLNIDKEKLILLVLIIFVVIYIAHNWLFLTYDNYLSYLDYALLRGAAQQYNAVANKIFNWKKMIATERSIYNLLTVPFFYLFGISEDTAVLQNFLFLLLLVFSVYRIGVIFEDKLTGVLACFQLLCYPAIFGFLRTYFTPLAVTALISFAIFCLLSSNNFTNRLKVFLLAVTFTILLKFKLEKPIVYLLCPIVFYVWQVYKDKKTKISRLRLNVGVFLISCLAVILLTYDFIALISKIKYYLVEVYGVTKTSQTARDLPFSISIFSVYLTNLFSTQLRKLGFMFLLPGLFFFFKNKYKYKWIIICWFLLPYLVYSLYYYFMRIRVNYYTVDYLPALALITSYGIRRILYLKPKVMGIIFFTMYIPLNITNYILISHFNRELPDCKIISSQPLDGKITLIRVNPYRDILEKIQGLIENIVARKGGARVVFINHYPLLHAVYGEVTFINAITHKKVSVYDFSDKLFCLEPPDSNEIVARNIQQADLIINGNHFYPSESLALAKEYKIYGAVYDFRKYIKREEDAYGLVINNFITVSTVKTPGYKADLLINKKIDLKSKEFLGNEQFFDREGSLKSCLLRIKNIQEMKLRMQEQLLLSQLVAKKIPQGNVSIAFDESTGHIFWKGKKLTKDEGVCLRLLSGGKWYSSVSHAFLHIDKLGSNTLVVNIDWQDLPLVHILEFKLKGLNCIDFKVYREVKGSIAIEQESFIFMFIEDFNSYIASDWKESKKFPRLHKNSYTWEDLWQDSAAASLKIGVINARNKNTVMLNCFLNSPENKMTISNTNTKHNARALFCNKNNKDNIKPAVGKYCIFEGKLEIN